MGILLFLIFVLSLNTASSLSACRHKDQDIPEFAACSCHPESNLLVITCKASRLEKIPTLPRDIAISLTITHDQIVALPSDLFSDAELVTLDLSSNGLYSINANAFRGLQESLRSLRIASNKLQEIPIWAIDHLIHLESLDLSGNRIKVIRASIFKDVTTLSSLRFIDLQNNEIDVVPTQSLRRLRALVLSLAKNRITTLEKLSLPKTLTILNLADNLLLEIPYLAFADQPDLRELNLEANRITTTDYNAEVTIANEFKLILRNNRISALGDSAFKSFRKFAILDLSYNEIARVSPHIFETVNVAREINLAHNRISHIGKRTFENVGKSMERLDLAWNDVHALPEALTDLRVLQALYLDGNKLSKLDKTLMTTFKDTLRELRVAYNHLSVVPQDVLDTFTNLSVLDMSKNRIESVHCINCRMEHLKKLYLAANRIGILNETAFFTRSPELIHLDLSFNAIEKVGAAAFSTLTSLSTLLLQNNKLKMIPRDALLAQSSLQTLLLDSNEIEYMPAQATSAWPRLARLSLSGNKIYRIEKNAFTATTALRILDVSKNILTVIHSSTFENIRINTILLSHNRIEVLRPLAFSNLHELRRVDLSHNNLHNLLAKAFINISNIDVMVLSHNKIDLISENAFYEVKRVGYFDLSHNHLKSFLCSMFTSWPRIEEIDVSYNNISKLELSCIKNSIVRLDLSHNEIQAIEAENMEGCHFLKMLTLSHNTLFSLPPNALTKAAALEIIDLAHNNLRIIRKGTFTQQNLIHSLNLSYNSLGSLHPEVLGNNNLLSLNMAGNQFSSIPVEGLRSVSKSLEVLDMSDNYITSIEATQFLPFTNLRKLVLSRNRLHSLEEDAFSALQKLQYLDLSDNPFSSWHPQTFRGLGPNMLIIKLHRTGLFSIPKFSGISELEELDLSGNYIREIDTNQFDSLQRLRLLNLSTNAIAALPYHPFIALNGSLEVLDMSGNPLHELSDHHIADAIRISSIKLNNLQSVYVLPTPDAYRKLTMLRDLEITNIPAGVVKYNITALLAALPPMHRLSLQVNDRVLADQLQMADMRGLRSLRLTGAMLHEISPGAFRNLRGFDFDLAITNTSINSFPPAIFDTLIAIQRLTLTLDYNKLTTLEPFLKTPLPLLNRQASMLQHVSLVGNPIICDCRMAWLQQWTLHTEAHPCVGKNFTQITCSALITTLPTVSLMLLLFLVATFR